MIKGIKRGGPGLTSEVCGISTSCLSIENEPIKEADEGSATSIMLTHYKDATKHT